MFLYLSMFLLSVATSTLIVYYWKRDSWGWRSYKSEKLARKTGVVCAILVFTVLGLALFESRDKKQSEYHDLALGMTKAQVVYIKGTPTNVSSGDLKDIWEPRIKTENIEAGSTIEDFNFWNYIEEKEQYIDIEFDKDGNGVVGIGCSSPLRRSCPSIRSLSTGNTEEDVLRRLGKPDTEEITNGVKTMSYKDLNILIKLKQKKVYFVGIHRIIN